MATVLSAHRSGPFIVHNSTHARSSERGEPRRQTLSSGLTEAQARALLRGCDRRRAVGRRDYAVMVLMLRLGLWAREVEVLGLEDIDWRAGKVTVHRKKARVDQLPLTADVGQVIVGHLQRGRPRTAAREVFVQRLRRGSNEPQCFRPDPPAWELARKVRR